MRRQKKGSPRAKWTGKKDEYISSNRPFSGVGLSTSSCSIIVTHIYILPENREMAY